MKNFLRVLRNAIGKGLYATFVALVTVSFVTGTLALANYAVTVGSGTNFGSVVVSSVHYAQQLICDLTTPSQCAAVSAAGAVKVDNSGVTQPVSGTVTANAGTNLNTSALSTSANQVTSISTLTGWTSATAGNSTQAIVASGATTAILVQLDQTSTISAGAVTFEGTFDGTNWVTVPTAQVLNPNTFAPLTNPYTLIASTNQPFLILTQGYQQVRIRLSTAITGSATVTPYVAILPYNPTIGALLNPLAAGSAIIGKVGIDQTTPGTTNAVAYSALAETAASSGVLKGSAGNLFTISVDAVTATTDLKLLIFNSATLPADGTVTPYKCISFKGDGVQASFFLSWGGGPPLSFATGISAAVSSNTACTTKANVTATISGQVQ